MPVNYAISLFMSVTQPFNIFVYFSNVILNFEKSVMKLFLPFRFLPNVSSLLSKKYSPCQDVSSIRRSSHDSRDRYKLIPSLMNFPVPLRPRFSHAIRNFIFCHFIIKPYYDPEFNQADFLDGAKSAVDFVSKCLSEGDLNTLEESDVISDECLNELNLNLSLFSHHQSQRLLVNRKDIFYNFIYQIGVILDDHDVKKRHVEVTYVAHAIPNLKDLMDEESLSFQDVHRINIEHETGPIVLACRFIRDYSKGVEDSWTINALNYLCIKDKAHYN